MDGHQELTAAEVLNTYSARELTRILRTYGEERFADRIARRIVAVREDQPFDTSARLVQVLDAVHPRRRPQDRRPPGQADVPGAADRGERRARRAGVGAAAGGGRARPRRPASPCWRTTRSRTGWSSRCWLPAPGETGPAGSAGGAARSTSPELRLLTRGADKPTDAEIAVNPRAASARFRAAERIREPRRPTVGAPVSALWAPLHSASRGAAPPVTAEAGQKTRRLRSVPARPARMARIPFITVLIAIFGVGMVGLLMLNTTLQNQAFESRALNRQATQLVYVAGRPGVPAQRRCGPRSRSRPRRQRWACGRIRTRPSWWCRPAR